MSKTQKRDFDDLTQQLRRVREEADGRLAMKLVAIEVTLARLVADAACTR